MTVPDQASRKIISGSGWVNPLTHAFPLENIAHLHVYADAVELVSGAHYSVTGIGNPTGYAVTILNPALWPSVGVWVLKVDYPTDQPSDVDQGGTFGRRFEDALDRVARSMQSLRDDVERSVKRPLTEDAPPVPILDGHVFISEKGFAVAGPTADDIQAAQEYAEQAHEAAERAKAFASMQSADKIKYKTVPMLAADEVLSYAPTPGKVQVATGDMTEAQGFRFEVAAPDAADPDLTTPALVNLFARPTQHGFINPEQYGLIGAGGNDHPKIQRALDSNYPVVIPPSICRVTEPLVMSAAGKRLYGYDRQNCIILSNSETPHDVLRMYGTQSEVSGLYLRGTMSAAITRVDQTAVVRVLAGHAKVRGNRIISHNAGHGVGIILDNVDPATGDLLGAGRYFHTIDDNWIGNYASDGIGPFYAGIRSFMWEIGEHATSILNNHIISDRGISIEGASGAGGNSGQRIFFNTLQSATGTQAAKVGIGINISQYSGHELIFGNYVELYEHGVRYGRADDTNGITLGAVGMNVWDNPAQAVSSAGAQRFVYQDFRNFMDWWNGWNTRYDNKSYVDFFSPVGGDSIRRVHADGAHAMQMVASRVKQTATLTGNDQVITPTSSQIAINGSGANRAGITIANGVHEGQELTITANTWGATIDNDGGVGGNQNIYFAGNAASCAMGNSATNVAMLKLKWVTAFIGANGAWVEQGRLTRP